ncbi:Multidrug resistance protein MdtB [Castellaniella defragrans]
MIVDINRDLLGRLGLSALSIDNALYDAFGQRMVSTIYTQSSQNRVILEARQQSFRGPAALGTLQIPVPGGQASRHGGDDPHRRIPLVSLTWASSRPPP